MHEELMVEEQEHEFSWSLSRKALFEFCPRAYFYHYYGATGGFERYSENEMLYMLKHLQNTHLWINCVVTRTLRELFHDNSGNFNFHSAAKRIFHQGVRSITLREWRDDPKLLNLKELYYDQFEINEVIETSAAMLEKSGKSLIESGLVDYLQRIPFLDRKLIKLPAAANIGKIKFWVSPALFWQENRLLKFLNLNFGKRDKNHERRLAAMHKLFAFNALRVSPERTVSLNFSLQTGETTFVNDSEINISGMIAEIKDSSAGMLSPLTDSKIALEGNFAVKTENCTQCRFQKYCRKRVEKTFSY
jgi:hypothetical protein